VETFSLLQPCGLWGHPLCEMHAKSPRAKGLVPTFDSWKSGFFFLNLYLGELPRDFIPPISRNHQSPLCGFTKFFCTITGLLSLSHKTPSWVNLHLRCYHSKTPRKIWVASLQNLPNSRNVPKSSELFLFGGDQLWPKNLGICNRIFFWCKCLLQFCTSWAGGKKTLMCGLLWTSDLLFLKIIKTWKFSENGTFCYKFSFFLKNNSPKRWQNTVL
jgi:hypothetical protein